MFRGFFSAPNGVGSGLNIYMFSPKRLGHLLHLVVHERAYFLARCRVILDQLLRPHDPWLTRDAIDLLKGYLRADMHAFEFGSGRSTRWLAARVGRLVSVEDDPVWYERVKRDLAGTSVDYRFAATTNGADDYVGQLLAYPDASFDLIVIDGSCRNACIAAAACKINPGGIIVIDNADQRYDLSPLDGFDRRSTSNGVWQTDIYIRPRDEKSTTDPALKNGVGRVAPRQPQTVDGPPRPSEGDAGAI